MFFDFLWERSSTKVPKGRKGPAVLAAGVFDKIELDK